MAPQIHEPEPPANAAVPFVPHHILKEAAAVPLVIAFLLALILFGPELQHEPANPYDTPAHIKPEWYFLAAYQVLKIVPSEILGIIIQGVAVTVLILLPLLDRGPRKRLRDRPVFTIAFILTVLAVTGLTVWGHYS